MTNEYKLTKSDLQYIKDLSHRRYISTPMQYKETEENFLSSCMILSFISFLKGKNIDIIDGNLVKREI